MNQSVPVTGTADNVNSALKDVNATAFADKKEQIRRDKILSDLRFLIERANNYNREMHSDFQLYYEIERLIRKCPLSI